TIVFNGLPPGDFPAPIFDIVLKGLTIRGSIFGTRQDMVEALEFYAAGKIHPTFSKRPLEDINAIFDEMIHGKIDGRVVIEYCSARCHSSSPGAAQPLCRLRSVRMLASGH